MFALLFNPEGGKVFSRNVGWLSLDCTALYLTRCVSSRSTFVITASIDFYLQREAE
jgi:hypothetical protein